MSKTTRARYTLEFKLEAIRLVKAGDRCGGGRRRLARARGPMLQLLNSWNTGKVG